MADIQTFERRTVKTLDANLARYEREAGKVLRDALNDMRGQMTYIYEKYAVDGELTLAQMTQYNRMKNLEGQMLETMDGATRKTVGQIKHLRPAEYDEGFFRYAWTVDQAGEIRLNWGQLNQNAIIESLDNRAYQLAIKTYTANARVAILRTLNDGLAQGKSYKQMASGMKDAINATQYQAMRIIRTEGQTAQTAGQEAAYIRAEQQGVDLGMIWDATLDTRTRDSHGRMDGTPRPEDGLFNLDGEKTPYPCWQGLSAAQRIQCRCRLRAELDDFSPALRRTRAGGVQPYQKYDDWAKGARAKPKPKPRAPKPKKALTDAERMQQLTIEAYGGAPPELYSLVLKHQECKYTYTDKGAHYASWKKTINHDKIRGPADHKLWENKPYKLATERHEYGHHLDYVLNQDPKLKAIIGAENFNPAHTVSEAMKKELRADLRDLRKDNYAGIMRLSDDIKNDLYFPDPSLSDCLDAATKKQVYGGYGHDKTYYKNQNVQLKEIFANLSDLYARPDRTGWDFIHKHFPKMTDKYEKIIKTAGGVE